MTVKEFIDFFKKAMAFNGLDEFDVSMCIEDSLRPNDIVLETDYAQKTVYVSRSGVIQHGKQTRQEKKVVLP